MSNVKWLNLIRDSLIDAGVPKTSATSAYLAGIAHLNPALTSVVEGAQELLTNTDGSDELLSPAEIGEQLGLTSIAVNQFLIGFGFQSPNPNKEKGAPRYLLTKRGETHGIKVQEEAGSFIQYRLKWKPSIIDILEAVITPTVL
ncbi:MAG: hypothetical protein F6K14_26815 [Symploca sp. SIO2C1]|nr:hypothetical protein [Symploca sp. SIO2C1]